jgi:hypothetical protein
LTFHSITVFRFTVLPFAKNLDNKMRKSLSRSRARKTELGEQSRSKCKPTALFAVFRRGVWGVSTQKKQRDITYENIKAKDI